jgi:3-hydroxyisobutyrate dehydrogenase-like beta-hydroxyacid dehydrogenase
MRAKLARNLITYAQWMATWEAAHLAVSAGVPLERFVEVVAASHRWMAPHWFLVERGAGLGRPQDPEQARLTATYADKDLRAALELGEELGLALPAARLALERVPTMTGSDDPPPREETRCR